MIENIKVVIPARYGSSRLPGKPLLLLKGKPMYWHVVQRVVGAGVDLDSIIIATDDERIVRSAKKESIPVQITSPIHVSGTDRINEVVSTNKWCENTLVLNVQGDEPLIPSSLIAELIAFSINNEKYEITTAVTPVKNENDFNNPNVVKAILAENNRALYFTRAACPFNRDNLTDYSLAYRHIGIYGYKVSALETFCKYSESNLERFEKLEQLRALSYGMSIGAIIVPDTPPHGIDTLEDYENLKRIMDKE